MNARIADLACLACLWLLLALLAGVSSAASAQERQASEAAVKAAFVFRFGDYVEWPDDSFAGPESPLQIGVVAADAFAAELARVVAGRTMAGRPVRVLRLAAGDPLDGLQLVYVGGARGDVAAVLGSAGDQPILAITEADGEIPDGSVINFVVVDAKVRFDIALRPAQARGLKISSRLLSVARRVEVGSR